MSFIILMSYILVIQLVLEVFMVSFFMLYKWKQRRLKVTIKNVLFRLLTLFVLRLFLSIFLNYFVISSNTYLWGIGYYLHILIMTLAASLICSMVVTNQSLWISKKGKIILTVTSSIISICCLFILHISIM